MFERWKAQGYGMAESGPAAPRELPASTKVPLERAAPLLSSSITKWLRVHGKTVKPKLTAEQQANLRLCFKMMDADGSGAVDADELDAAFKLLGLNVSKREVEALLQEVDKDGSGEVEFPEFLEIMTIQLAKLAEHESEQRGAKAGGGAAAADDSASSETEAVGASASDVHGTGGAPTSPGSVSAAVLPFNVVATAYRRKKLMAALQEDNKEFFLSVAEAEEAERRRKAEAEAAAQRVRQRRPSVLSPGGSPGASSAGARSTSSSPRAAAGVRVPCTSPGASTATGGSSGADRLQSRASFLDSLGKEERHIIETLSRKYYREEEGGAELEPQLAGGAAAGSTAAARSRSRAAGSRPSQQRPPHLAALRAGAAGMLLSKWGARGRSPSPQHLSQHGGSPSSAAGLGDASPAVVRYRLTQSRLKARRGQCGPSSSEEGVMEEGLLLPQLHFSKPRL